MHAYSQGRRKASGECFREPTPHWLRLGALTSVHSGYLLWLCKVSSSSPLKSSWKRIFCVLVKRIYANPRSHQGHISTQQTLHEGPQLILYISSYLHVTHDHNARGSNMWDTFTFSSRDQRSAGGHAALEEVQPKPHSLVCLVPAVFLGSWSRLFSSKSAGSRLLSPQ